MGGRESTRTPRLPSASRPSLARPHRPTRVQDAAAPSRVYQTAVGALACTALRPPPSSRAPPEDSGGLRKRGLLASQDGQTGGGRDNGMDNGMNGIYWLLGGGAGVRYYLNL